MAVDIPWISIFLKFKLILTGPEPCPMFSSLKCSGSSGITPRLGLPGKEKNREPTVKKNGVSIRDFFQGGYKVSFKK